LRRVPIRLKFAGALAVPLVALVAVTILEVVQTSDARSEIRQQTDLARAAIGPSGLLITLQNERTWPAVEIFGFDSTVTVPVAGYEETRRETDAAIAAFDDQLEDRDEAIAETFQPALDGLARLDELRAEIDSFGEREHSTRDTILFGFDVFERYTEMIAPFFDATTRVAKAVADPDLRQGAELADAVARQIETTALLANATITNALLTENGVDLPSEITDLSVLRSDLVTYAADMRGAYGPYAPVADEHYPQDLIAGLSAQVDQAIATHRISLDALLGAMDMPRDAGLFGYQSAIHDIITERANELDANAESRQLFFGALAVGALVLAAGLTWVVSHSITAPLRSLTRQAKEMAGRRLPDAVRDVLDRPLGDDVFVPEIAPISVNTSDEVADVAEALNTVQDSALDLAVEQAVLRRNIADSFVNLGRRNQNLLGRQLDFITELESRETDSDSLGSLFQLDHLATRMRRNAESLLVLAGVDPPRKWAAPVRLADIVRSALGEVEDYQRATVHALEPVTVIGSAAADLTHLIAELVENALSFSPADRQVEVRGRHRPDTGGYSLAVVDFGPGMPPHEIEQANRRLAGAESFTVAPSKYLGHYVAGNLAGRLGAHLWLDGSPGAGITVTIDLPPVLLAGGANGDPTTPPNATPSIAARAAFDAGGTPDTNEPPPPPPGPARPAMRTASGLVKRVPQPVVARSSSRPRPSGAERSADALTGEMLAALTESATRARADARIGPLPAGGSGGTAGPAVPPGSPASPGTPGGAPARRGRSPVPGTGPTGVRPAAGRGTGGRSGPARVPPSGGAARPGAPGWRAPGPAPTPSPAPGGPGGRGSTGAPGGRWTVPPGEPNASGGLTPRVRGAQLPASDPIVVTRRASGRVMAPGQGPANDVYAFLSSFTAGVQRGLDEARRAADPPESQP
jgi:signal transduction histidine kinase